MEIKIAICDDEHRQTEYIKMLVSAWADENNIKISVDMFESAESFKAAWSEEQTFDILLLDIEMGGQNGIELAREIRRSDAKLIIIFITGFTDYMPEGYDVSALHYLVKPVKEDKLFPSLKDRKKIK
jgi:DNA-binding LytR/AlgR family response regulator